MAASHISKTKLRFERKHRQLFMGGMISRHEAESRAQERNRDRILLEMGLAFSPPPRRDGTDWVPTTGERV